MTDTGDRVFLAEGLVTVTQTRFVFKARAIPMLWLTFRPAGLATAMKRMP